MPKVEGNLKGLKPSQIDALTRLYKRRFPTEAVYTALQAQELALLSRSLNRQLALLIDRKGKVNLVLAGSAERIVIPELAGGKLGQGRLRGVRLLHTHVHENGLSEEDLMDLLFLRLDNIAVLTVSEFGQPLQLQYAQLDPKNNPPYTLSPLLSWDDRSLPPLAEEILGIEANLQNHIDQTIDTSERAILVSVSPLPRKEQEKNLAELAKLAQTAGIVPTAQIVQRTRAHNNRSILGKGKLAELEVVALQNNAATLLFDGELSPAEQSTVAEITERRVLDRTQLILDIFAQHAKSKAGKLQVELAQLKYLQPRLVGKNKALDRLMGGIGGRGPGETKLETDRRKNRDRIAQLRKELDAIANQRAYVRSQRKKNGIPVAVLVGYTNAGKSTLLNTLSKSHVLTADKLFATLDPVSRRLRFPKAQEVLFADTIGFIRNLPRELIEAFQATLDDINDADLLLHVVDAASPDIVQQMQSVEEIIQNLAIRPIPSLLLFNKWDALSAERKEILHIAYPDALCVSANTGWGLRALEERVLKELFHNV